ncbi:glycosyl hydrolase family 28-related protein [Desertivirga brevis]|uniref:glycosyl hydrolase family 28-related protein n=1 Tax=Desertivirga brevis TaxID=2810310 RepID=UPI001A96EA6B|nr:glycosyl hydrolase family 28-related protein [Pedobacter sp. SYSU D00873]
MRKFYWTALLYAFVFTTSCKKEEQEELIVEEKLSIRDKLSASTASGGNSSLPAIGLVGDGKTDNRSTLQNLINDAASKQKTLVLPAGKFLVTDEIILPSNTSLQGQGIQTEIILSAGSVSGRNVLRVPTRTSNVSIKNLKIDANQDANTGSRLVAFFVTDNTTNVSAEEVSFAGGKDGGSVQVKGLNDYPVKDLRFVKCTFLHAGRTLLELRGTRNTTISNCVFQNWGSQSSASPALQLQSQDNTETTITNNVFSNSMGTQYAIESTASTTKNTKIENNIFNDAKHIGGNGIGGTFSFTTIVRNKFGGGDGKKFSGLDIKGNNNNTNPNDFSSNAFPVSDVISAPVETPAKPSPSTPVVTTPIPSLPTGPTAPSTSAPNASGLKGDGVTDNRNQLQSLVNSYASRNQALVLPAGRFVISNEIILPSNLTIEGAGGATEIILSAGGGSNRKVFRIPTRMSNIKIKNLTLNANFAANTGAHLVSFYVTDNTRNVSAENVTFSGGRDGGVVQAKGLNAYPIVNLSFVNCRFTDGGRTSLELRGTKDAVVSNCDFTRWGLVNPNSPSLQLQSQENFNTRIIGNTFENTHGKQFAIECAAAYVTNSKIADNKLNDPKGLGGNGISGYYKGTVFSGNVMNGGNGNHRSGYEVFGSNNTITGNTIHAGCIAISPGFTEDGTGVVISNNVIKTKNPNVGGVQLGGGKYNLNNIRIVKNTIDTRASSGNSSAIVLGTYNATRAVSDITIEENTIYTNAHCIRVQASPGSRNVYVYRNHFKAGYTWLGVITNTVSNIVSEGNINELKNKSASYSSR